MATQLAKVRKSPQDKVYEALTRRLEPFAKKLAPEDQTELDGVVSRFAEAVIGAFKVVSFFGEVR